MPAWFTKLSDRTLDVTTLVFALWTIACNATVIGGGNGRALIIVEAVVFSLVAIAIWGPRRTPRTHADEPAARPGEAAAEPPGDLRVTSAIGLLCALGLFVFWQQSRAALWTWLATCAFFTGASLWLVLRRPPHAPAIARVEPTPRDEALLWLLAVVGALGTLFLHLANTDDVVYINFGVALADHPELKLYAFDTIHDAGVPLLPAYSVHSFELLGGAISLVTRIPALLVIHLGLATIAGLLTALAWARLFRLLDPERWLWMTAIVVSMYLFDGSEMRSFAMHGFVRIFQGKAILLTVAVPLISANAIAFAHAPSRRALLLLSASVICGVGLSSTGLWLAPFVAGTALLVALAPRLSSLAVLGVGLLSCVYPVALGLWVRAVMIAQRKAAALAAAKAVTDDATRLAAMSLGKAFAMIGQAMSITFGSRMIALAYLSCLFLAWPLARTELAKRYIVLFCAIAAVLLFNPQLIEFLQTNVTGKGTYSRVLWYLPIPAAFAICFASTIPSDGSRLGQLATRALSCGALCLFYVAVPKQTVFTAGNFEVSLLPKVDRRAYDLARLLAEMSPAGSRLLAPHDVALHVPLVQHHPYPVMTKPPLFKSERAPRFALRKVTDGEHKPMNAKRRAWFIDGLNRFHVDTVVLAPEATAPGLDDALSASGFSLVRTFEGERVWTRPLRPSRRR